MKTQALPYMVSDTENELKKALLINKIERKFGEIVVNLNFGAKNKSISILKECIELLEK